MAVNILLVIAVTLRIVLNPFGNVFQKKLTNAGCNPLVINSITYFILSVACIFIAFTIKWPFLNRTFWIYSILGGIAGATGNGFLVKALEKGDLSVLGPINSYKSVVGIITGIFLLSEIPNLWGVAGVILIVSGSYFVLDTTEERFSFALFKRSDIRYRFMAMVLTAVEAVFIKKVILSSSATIAFISWCVSGTIFSLLLIFLFRVDPGNMIKNTFKRDNLIKYLLLVICIGITQYTTTYSFDHMPVGYALALFQLSAIISIFFGYRFFREKDIGRKILGSVIMIAGSILIILLKNG